MTTVERVTRTYAIEAASAEVARLALEELIDVGAGKRLAWVNLKQKVELVAESQRGGHVSKVLVNRPRNYASSTRAR